MSNDWKPGDIALCIAMPSNPDINPTRPGKQYTVERVWLHPRCGLALDFVGIFNGAKFGYGFWGHLPSRFIKVSPEEADEFDKETIELYNKKPTKEFI